MCLGTIYISTKFRHDWTSNMAAILENQLGVIDWITFAPRDLN
jgi:hypothetical protein